MNLKITKDHHNNETHTGPVFEGAEDREFQYQNEGVYGQMSLKLHGWPPGRQDGVQNRNLEEPLYSEYELVIERFTGKSIAVKLIGRRKDIVAQRRRTGKAILSDELHTTISFGELINRIFSTGGQVFHETEAFPECVRKAMLTAYPER